MASTKVENWARKPGCRIAAKDRLAGSDALTDAAFVSFIKNHQFAAQRKSHIPQRDALDMFEWNRDSNITVQPAAMSMAFPPSVAPRYRHHVTQHISFAATLCAPSR
jgi:hypothetical protein